ncbi:FdrA family protein [uncultured Ornithinimicrobium sp.]|uniref:FdrA family protein n=1 Tax=uncultured Ornithinimicrobium sp. TaxID=259307 RepID=UPI00259241EF|nr:FdrA family protein [uncultured Ornithinimicrobium sp.]
MTDSVEIRRGVYHDSVTLMQVSQRVRTAPGVQDALIGMGTELNLGLMRDVGFDVPAEAGPNDLVVALRGDDETAVAAGQDMLTAVLAELHDRSRAQGSTTEVAPRTVGSAARRGSAGIALVSTPGQYAALDALDAVNAGLSVMLFSDNVPLEEEIALKDAAGARDVLVMGPDCGTAVVNGAALGFANVVRPGRIGMVAASGTGAQQVMSLLDLAGEGISHCLGLGGRDLSAEVGGRSAKQALRALAADEATEHVVIVSKPAAEEVVGALEELAGELGVSVTWATLGRGRPDLTAATEQTLRDAGAQVPESWPSWGADGEASTGASGSTGHLRGLFCGGTLADEAMIIAEDTLGPIASNIPLDGAPHVSGHDTLTGHAVVDFGEDEMTQGRAHPMIDPSLRLESIRAQGADPTCGVLLLDLVLGHGSHPDPAGDLAAAVGQARSAAEADGRTLPVVVSLVGTESDPQGLQRCAETLAVVGASIFTSNAAATRAALAHLGGTR